MKRFTLISLTTLAAMSFAAVAQAETQTEPAGATETNEIISPDDNSPVNVVNPGADTSEAADPSLPAATSEETDVTPATERNTIVSPDDESPVNVVNPGTESGDGATYTSEEPIEDEMEEPTPGVDQNTIISPDEEGPGNVENPGSES
ncbi:MAG: hypothetical protein AAGF01_14900 [Cyanobacteria bacterium P01_G01_bin.38]